MSYTGKHKMMADGPNALAYRMASYIADPNYIAGYVRREYGQSPPVGEIQAMRLRHERARAPRKTALDRRIEASERRQQEQAERLREQQEARDAELAAKRAQQAEDGAAAYEALRSYDSKAGRIVAAVAFAFVMTPAMLISKRRAKRFVLARQVAIRLLRDRTREDGRFLHSLPAIGRLMGDRDHSTIMYALDTFEDSMRHHANAKAIYERLRALI